MSRSSKVLAFNGSDRNGRKPGAEVEAPGDSFRKLLEATQCVIWETGFEQGEGAVADYVSDGVYAMLGYTPEEVLFSQDLLAHFAQEGKSCGAGETRIDEVLLTAKDGREVWVEVRSEGIGDPEGKVIGARGVMIDITDRKLLEAKYRQAQKLEPVGLLAGGIAHDFNNLLTAIAGCSELTLNRMLPDDPLRANLEEIAKTCERASDLSRRLLAFSRKREATPAVQDLNSVVEDVDQMLRRVLRENVALQVELVQGLPNIMADQGQIEQILMNLAVNAQDAMPYGGRVTIKTEHLRRREPGAGRLKRVRMASFVKLTFSDTGEGIDDQIKDRIFEPFFTTKGDGKGSGLGLATVHDIVRQLGGEITVSSRAGSGTTFEIYFPAVGAPSNAPAWPSKKLEVVTGADMDLVAGSPKTLLKGA